MKSYLKSLSLAASLSLSVALVGCSSEPDATDKGVTPPAATTGDTGGKMSGDTAPAPTPSTPAPAPAGDMPKDTVTPTPAPAGDMPKDTPAPAPAGDAPKDTPAPAPAGDAPKGTETPKA